LSLAVGRPTCWPASTRHPAGCSPPPSRPPWGRARRRRRPRHDRRRRRGWAGRAGGHGDLSACRTERAPGAFRAEAAGFDASVPRRSAPASRKRLLDLDPAQAGELLVAGRVPLQVLAGACDRRTGHARPGPVRRRALRRRLPGRPPDRAMTVPTRHRRVPRGRGRSWPWWGRRPRARPRWRWRGRAARGRGGERRRDAGLPGDGHRDGQADPRGAGAGAPSPGRPGRPGRGVLGGAVPAAGPGRDRRGARAGDGRPCWSAGPASTSTPWSTSSSSPRPTRPSGPGWRPRRPGSACPSCTAGWPRPTRRRPPGSSPATCAGRSGALEVMELTGRPFSSFRAAMDSPVSRYR
jgi:hypothetical protein